MLLYLVVRLHFFEQKWPFRMKVQSPILKRQKLFILCEINQTVVCFRLEMNSSHISFSHFFAQLCSLIVITCMRCSCWEGYKCLAQNINDSSFDLQYWSYFLFILVLNKRKKRANSDFWQIIKVCVVSASKMYLTSFSFLFSWFCCFCRGFAGFGDWLVKFSMFHVSICP